MKLNYKKTIFVGFAFFLICAFWQAYDSIVPMMLVNKFGLSQTVSGVIMSLDNVIAVFLLPLFGSLSDKTKSKFGRRTPYIVIGTVVAAFAFFGLTFADNAQLKKLGSVSDNSGYVDLFEENYTITPNTAPLREKISLKIIPSKTIRQKSLKISFTTSLPKKKRPTFAIGM